MRESTRPPIVSVIVPTYDRPAELKRAVQSILDQTYQDFEIVVVNDGGVEVREIVEDLNRGGQIAYVRHSQNQGLAAARNTAIRSARGKYLAYLDDDDTFLPEHLETLARFLEANAPTFKFAYTDAWRLSLVKNGSSYLQVGRDIVHSNDFDPNAVLLLNPFPVLCAMHQKVCLEDVGMFDESLSSHEDWDLWIRMSRRFPFAHIKRATAEYTWRTDGTSMTSGAQEAHVATIETIYRKYRHYAEANPSLLAAQRRQIQLLREWGRPAPLHRLPSRAWDYYRIGGLPRLWREARSFARQWREGRAR